MSTLPEPRPAADSRAGRHAAAIRRPGDTDDGSFIRPFIVTEGHTAAGLDLHVETLVQASGEAPRTWLTFERRQIVELCQAPLSLAEIAVALNVPLGVARVLVADLAAAGLVTVHAPAELALDVLVRIRDLVQAL
jgi:uncharacterized surface protein with fasciclin (FAS1) repeats